MQPITWKTVKTDMSKYVSSGGTHGSARHILRQAVKANGGAHRMTSSSTSGIRAAKNIGSFFAGIKENGISVTLQHLGIQYLGRSVGDVFSRLVNVFAPASETKEDIVARDASQAAMSGIYEYIADNNMNLESVDHMPVEIMDKAMKLFLTEYIWGSIMKDLECRIEKYMVDVSSACEREQELKDTIGAVVDVEYDNQGSLMQKDLNDAVTTLMERCLNVLEGIL
jgi:hypothetical protein